MRELSTYPQVLESVRNIGQLLPVYLWQGAVLDGAKRHQACLETGNQPKFETLTDEHAAASLLWSLHPHRAIEMFASGRTLVDLCVLCSAKPSSVLAIMRELDRKRDAGAPKRYERRAYHKRMTVRFPEDAHRIVYSLAKLHATTKQDVIVAALRAAATEAIVRELRRMRQRRG